MDKQALPDEGAARFQPLRSSTSRVVLRTMVEKGPISRAEIARITGLSKQTISDIMRGLLRDGWVREDGQVQGSIGRSATTYELRGDAAHVVGIDLGGSKIHVGLADLCGRIVAERLEPTSGDGAMAVLRQIARITSELVRELGLPPDAVRAGAMGSPGVVDPLTGRIRIAENIPGLDEINVPVALTALIGAPMVVENDVNLAAKGEQWQGGHREVRNFAFIALGTGIGMGVIVDGKLVRGGSGGAGEIAYLPIGGDPFDPRNRRLGTLETAAGSAAIVARHAGLGGSRQATVRSILDVMGSDDAPASARGQAADTMAEVYRTLAAAILAVCSVVDPELVVLGGSIGARDEVRVGIEASLRGCMEVPVPVTVSTLGSRATLIGSVARALTHLHENVLQIDAVDHPLLPATAQSAP